MIEGRFEPWDCASTDERCGEGDHNRCALSHFYGEFKQTVEKLMKGYTLETLCQRAAELKGGSPNAQAAALSIFGEFAPREPKEES